MGEEHYVSTSHTYSCDSLARRLHTVPYLRPSHTRPIYGATPCYPHDMCATAAHRQIAAARRLRLQALSPGCGGNNLAASQVRARSEKQSERIGQNCRYESELPCYQSEMLAPYKGDRLSVRVPRIKSGPSTGLGTKRET